MMGKTKRAWAVVAVRVVAAMTAVMFSVLAVLPAQAAAAADYEAVFDAAYYAERYPDLKAAFGTDEAALLNHFITCGMAEGRQGNAEFNVQCYREKYADLQSVFGDNLPAYYTHYMTCGKAEGRTAVEAEQTGGQDNAGSKSEVRGGWDVGMGYELLGYENMERENAGLKLLVWEDDLTIRAQLRARELAADFSHTSAGGYTRECLENIAGNQQDMVSTIAEWTRRNESTERMNILHPTNRLTAIGVYVDDKGMIYVAQLFTEHVK